MVFKGKCRSVEKGKIGGGELTLVGSVVGRKRAVSHVIKSSNYICRFVTGAKQEKVPHPGSRECIQLDDVIQRI